MAVTKEQKSRKIKTAKALDFKATISKWGNSYAIHIPKEIMSSYGLKEGDKVRVPRIHKDIELEKIRGMLKGSKMTSERDIKE